MYKDVQVKIEKAFTGFTEKLIETIRWEIRATMPYLAEQVLQITAEHSVKIVEQSLVTKLKKPSPEIRKEIKRVVEPPKQYNYCDGCKKFGHTNDKYFFCKIKPFALFVKPEMTGMPLEEWGLRRTILLHYLEQGVTILLKGSMGEHTKLCRKFLEFNLSITGPWKKGDERYETMEKWLKEEKKAYLTKLKEQDVVRPKQVRKIYRVQSRLGYQQTHIQKKRAKMDNSDQQIEKKKRPTKARNVQKKVTDDGKNHVTRIPSKHSVQNTLMKDAPNIGTKKMMQKPLRGATKPKNQIPSGKQSRYERIHSSPRGYRGGKEKHCAQKRRSE